MLHLAAEVGGFHSFGRSASSFIQRVMEREQPKKKQWHIIPLTVDYMTRTMQLGI